MNTAGWTRRSSNAKPFRSSNPRFGIDSAGMRQSRGVDGQSRIPLRSYSSQWDRLYFPQGQQISKSVPPSENTPASSGKVTPSQSGISQRITPSCSSSRTTKKISYCKDLRNLHDKEFQKEAAFVVQKFFQSKCPEVLINGTEIRPMTIKMFIAMVNYLFEALEIVDKRQEAVKFELTTYEKELPYWMKKLNYPGLITKAWLQTVNVPNNWHHVVALLSWLVKLCEISALFNFEEQLEMIFDDHASSWAIYFFKKSLQAIALNIEGKIDESLVIPQEVLQKFCEVNDIDQNKYETLQQEIEELNKKLADPNALAEKDTLDETIQKLKILDAQNGKLIDEIAKKEDEIEQKKAKILLREGNCDMLKATLTERRKELEALKSVVSNQPTTAAELADLRKKIEYIDKEVNYLEKECEDYSHLISRYEFEAAAKRDMILQSTSAFNRNIIQLEQVMPELKEFRIYGDPADEEILTEMEKMVKSLNDLKNKKLNDSRVLEAQLKQKEKDIEMKLHSLQTATEMITKLEENIEARKSANISLEVEYEEKEKSLSIKLQEWDEKLHAVNEKFKQFEQLKNKHQTLILRHKDLCLCLKKTEELAEQFWCRVTEKWQHIPEKLEALIKLVQDQNVEIKNGYSQLMTELENSINSG